MNRKTNLAKLILKKINYFLLGILILSHNLAFGSIPPFTISDIMQNHKGTYFGEQGYLIHTDNTNWFQLDSSKVKSKSVKAEYRSLDDQNPSKLTVRAESLKKKLSLSQYVKKSVKDYRRFGFKILDLRPLKINQYNAIVLDLDKTEDDLQSRQILFKKNNNIVILTCTGHRFKFQIDLNSCNQIARNFQWVE